MLELGGLMLEYFFIEPIRFILIILLTNMLVFGVMCFHIARAKGKSGLIWFVLGSLLGIIGLLSIGFLPAQEKTLNAFKTSIGINIVIIVILLGAILSLFYGISINYNAYQREARMEELQKRSEERSEELDKLLEEFGE